VVWVERQLQVPSLAMAGEHQHDNASVAAAAVALLLPGADPAITWRGIANARLAARCQVVTWRGRRLLIDGAHNGASIAATIAAAASILPPQFTVVLGVASDKEIDEIAAVVPPHQRVVRCGYDSPRARDRDQWPDALRRTPWYDRIADVLAREHADLCITGSLYLAGEALHLVDQDPATLPG
jgi:dihydrofolate synthase / folylpolyglutamate synthase